jgi:hypothetical protein
MLDVWCWMFGVGCWMLMKNLDVEFLCDFLVFEVGFHFRKWPTELHRDIEDHRDFTINP